MNNFLFYMNIAHIVMMACSAFSAIIGVLNRKKFRTIRHFYLYPLASFIQMVAFHAAYITGFDLKTQNAIAYWTVNIFLLVEFLMISHFFLTVLKSPTMKAILYTISILYLALVCYLWFQETGPLKNAKNLFIPEAIVLLTLCILYFIELFTRPLTIKLSEDFNFWISLGVMFYFGCTLPLFLVLKLDLNTIYFESTYVYFINYICYSIFFLLIARAYLCREKNEI